VPWSLLKQPRSTCISLIKNSKTSQRSVTIPYNLCSYLCTDGTVHRHSTANSWTDHDQLLDSLLDCPVILGDPILTSFPDPSPISVCRISCQRLRKLLGWFGVRHGQRVEEWKKDMSSQVNTCDRNGGNGSRSSMREYVIRFPSQLLSFVSDDSNSALFSREVSRDKARWQAVRAVGSRSDLNLC
jgi:hypothetical protein